MSIIKRGDGFGVKIYDRHARKHRWVGTFETRAQARKAEAEAIIDGQAETATVAWYAGRWLEQHPRPKRATNLHYADAIAPFVREYGQRQLGSFSRVQAREWALEHRGQHQTVRTMFSDAMRDGLIRDNPFTGLRLTQSRGRKDLDVLTVDDVTRLAGIARELYGPNFAAFVVTAAYCGLRPGELYALTFDHIDWPAQEVRVAAQYSTRARETTSPKNNNQRIVPLFPEAAEALRELPRDPGPIFRTLTGKPLNGRALHYYWNPIRVAFGRPSMTTYELRHFFASHMLNTLGHEAEDIAIVLGHTDGGTLLRKLYGHPSERLALERLKRGFGRKVVPLRDISGA